MTNAQVTDDTLLAAEAAPRAATLFAQAAMHTLATKGAFHAALCGGPGLRAMLSALASLPANRRFDWHHVHVFAVEDAWDEASMNALAACPLPGRNVRRPRSADIPRHDAARRYEQQLASHFGLRSGELPVFDFMLLSATVDGRVAGFWPEEKAAANVTRLVVTHDRGEPRIALALPVINASRILALVCDSADLACAALFKPQGEFHLLSPRTARSSGAATPPTLRASRKALPPT
jgi:6-phosphogluconolactonase/glucosamine-6-phosphate isomerase/deaminase